MTYEQPGQPTPEERAAEEVRKRMAGLAENIKRTAEEAARLAEPATAAVEASRQEREALKTPVPATFAAAAVLLVALVLLVAGIFTVGIERLYGFLATYKLVVGGVLIGAGIQLCLNVMASYFNRDTEADTFEEDDSELFEAANEPREAEVWTPPPRAEIFGRGVARPQADE